MNKFSWKSLLPHVAAVAIFLIVSLIFCKPALEGKVLQQHDITQWKAMARDIYEYKAAHGEVPLWTKSMFSGMPGYMIATKSNNVVPYYVQEVLSLFLPKPFRFFFLASICFYFFCIVLRIRPTIAIIGGLAYAYVTYNPVIIGAGHDTKMLSIGLLPGLIAGIILIYEKRYWLGAGVTAALAGAIISVNHLQITYYGLIIAFIMTLGYIVHWVRAREYKHMVIAAAFALVSGLVGVLSNAVTLFTTYEYSKETIRGGSQLADGKGNIGKDGLNEDYALSYSMAIPEPMVMMFPRMYGGSGFGIERPQEESKALERVGESQAPQIAGQLPYMFYWGGIGASTDGPPYVGAIICALALIGFAVLSGKHKWWALGAIVFSVMLSWGSFFPGFNKAMLDILPFYDKFRAPSMIIVIPTFLLVMLAVLTLNKLVYDPKPATFNKSFKNGLYILAGVFGVALLLYMSLDYKGEVDNSLLTNMTQYPEQVQNGIRAFLSGLKEDRQHLFLMDIVRSLFFAGAAALMLFLFLRNKVSRKLALGVIGVLAIIDVLSIDLKYLHGDRYQDREDYETQNFSPTKEDQQILLDKTYYRVLDLRSGGIGGAFNQGAMTANFHNSVGGYHPAKLSIYQDLIEKQLYRFPQSLQVYNMLNTKYVIQSDGQNTQVVQNPDALGAAWFVKTIKWVNGPKAEMDALDTFVPKDTVVIDRKFESIGNKPFSFDSTARIEMIKNDNDVISYKYKAASPQFAVFSEVYYSKGWQAYIDGKPVDHLKANYVLRAMPVPAGEHTIEFRFDPQSHKIGSTVTIICSALMLLLLAFGLFKAWKGKDQVTNELHG